MREAQADIGARRGIEWGERVLIVDDDDMARRSLARVLTRAGMDVSSASSGPEALVELERSVPPLIISDLRMPGMDGIQLLREVRDRFAGTQRVLLTGHADVEVLLEATNKAHVNRVLLKPYDHTTLLLTIRSALEQAHLVRENQRLMELSIRQNEELREVNIDLQGAVLRRSRQLAESKTMWERTFDALPFPVAVVGKDHRIRLTNRTFARAADATVRAVLGREVHEALLGNGFPPLADLLDDEVDLTRDEIHLEVEARGDVVYELQLLPLRELADPAWPELPEDGYLAGERAFDGEVLCVYRDVSSQRASARRGIQMERMYALGELAAGVAHELNNPLGGILALSQVLLRDAGLTGDDLEIVEDIEDAAKRASKVIRALLQFARDPRSDTIESIDVAKVVSDAVAITRATTRHANVHVDVTIEAELPEIVGSAALLQQALVALLKNAAEANARAGANAPGRSIMSSAQQSTVAIRGLAQGQDVWLEVADEGPGVPEDQAGRLFTPFVTSRDTVEGAGLGLALVSRVVEAFGGHVDIRSGPEGGATFRLVLPAAVRDGV